MIQTVNGTLGAAKLFCASTTHDDVCLISKYQSGNGGAGGS